MATDQRVTRIYNVEVDATDALRSLKSVDRNTKSINDRFEKVEKSASRLSRTLKNAFAAGVLIAGIRRLTQGLTQAADAAADLQSRLSSISGGPQNTLATFEALFDVAQRLGVPIETLGNSLQKFAIAVPTASVEELVFTLETVTQALTTTGTGLQGTNAVLLQLVQGFGAGSLQGDEFKSVLENAPVLLRAIANAGGRAGESLKALRDEQFFTTQVALDNAQAIRDNIESLTGLARPADTIERAFIRIGNAFTATLFRTQQQGSPFAQFAEQLTALSTVVGPATVAAVNTLSASFSALGAGIDFASQQLDRLLNLFPQVGTEAEKVEGELGLLGFTFAVTLPAAIRSLPEIISTAFGRIREVVDFTGAGLGIRFAQAVEGIRNVWIRFAIFLGSIFADAINGVLSTFESFANRAVDIVNTVRAGVNVITGADFAALPEIGVGRLEIPESATRELEESTRRIQFLQTELEDLGRTFSQSFSQNRISDIFQANLIEDAAKAVNLVTEGLEASDRARKGSLPALESEKKSKSDLAKIERERLAELRFFNKELEKEAALIKRLNDEQQDYTDSLQDELRALDERLLLLSAPEADRDRIADSLEIESRLRKLNTDILREENAQRRESLKIRRDEFRAAVPEILTQRDEIRKREAEEAGRESGNAFTEGFETASEGIKGLFVDIFQGGLDEAQSFGDRLRDILTNTVDRILEGLVDTFVNGITQGISQGFSGIGGGGSSFTGGGGGGLIQQLFGGLFGGGSPVGLGDTGGPISSGAGGGGFNFAGIAGGLGGLAGGLLAGAFDSQSSVRETSPLELDPLPDDFSGRAPEVTIVNNGTPLRVDSTSRRSNGDYQLIVSDAVAQTQSVYERQSRRGFGGFAESLRNNTTADNSV